jgi:hypothetical protein
MVLGGREDGGFRFRSQMNQVIRNDEDPRYDGELKFQWLHANSRNLDREDGSCWMATVIATGQRGMLKLELSSSARGSASGKTVHAESLLKFGDQGDTRTLRAVIDVNTLADDGKAPKLQLQAIWKPLDSQSQLGGSASLVGIEIPGAIDATMENR